MIGICTSESEIQIAIKEIDEGGDGMIQWGEFLRFMAKKLLDSKLMNAEIDMAFEGGHGFKQVRAA